MGRDLRENTTSSPWGNSTEAQPRCLDIIRATRATSTGRVERGSLGQGAERGLAIRLGWACPHEPIQRELDEGNLVEVDRVGGCQGASGVTCQGGVGVPKNTRSTPESEHLCGGGCPQRAGCQVTAAWAKSPFLPPVHPPPSRSRDWPAGLTIRPQLDGDAGLHVAIKPKC